MKAILSNLIKNLIHFFLDKISGNWYNHVCKESLLKLLQTARKSAKGALKTISSQAAPCNSLDNRTLFWALSTSVCSVVCLNWHPEGVVLAGFLGALFTPQPQVQSAYQAGTPQGKDLARLGSAVEATSGDVSALQPGMQAGVNAQQDVLGQLLMQSQGKGPNPALMMLQNQTGQNIANQMAMAASQPGASANPALAARQAAMTGAQIQQDSAGQAALLGAQQQLAAQQAAAGLGGQLVQQQQQGRQLANQGAESAANLAMQDINQFNANRTQQYGAKVGNLTSGLNSMVESAGEVFGRAHGGKIPGKPKVSGDSEQNDTVPTLLSPGEIVIPRTFASNPEAAAAFAHACALFANKKGK